MYNHIPVLLNEAIQGLNIKSDGIYVDLTLGRAGHSAEILKRLTNGQLIAIDQDDEAIKYSENILKEVGKNYHIVKSNFCFLNEILQKLNIKKVDGILMDLGVSSPQFDNPERGFSYHFDTRLDMRMDQNSTKTAYDVVNTYPLEELIRIFKEYGNDKYSYYIAKNIVNAREKKPIETTKELVDIIKKSKPAKELKKVGHPAKQIFQAIRIEVNDELNVLKKALEICSKVLKSKGRLVVITFHSGEDKIVKDYFKKLAVIEGNRINIPLVSEEKQYQIITTHPITPSESELENNHRSVSAKLRILERK